MKIMVLQRSEVDKIVKSIPPEERKIMGMGIKIGRYHIYLPNAKTKSGRISYWFVEYIS